MFEVKFLSYDNYCSLFYYIFNLEGFVDFEFLLVSLYYILVEMGCGLYVEG